MNASILWPRYSWMHRYRKVSIQDLMHHIGSIQNRFFYTGFPCFSQGLSRDSQSLGCQKKSLDAPQQRGRGIGCPPPFFPYGPFVKLEVKAPIGSREYPQDREGETSNNIKTSKPKIGGQPNLRKSALCVCMYVKNIVTRGQLLRGNLRSFPIGKIGSI